LKYIRDNENEQSLKPYSLQLKKISRLVISTDKRKLINILGVHNVCKAHINSRITDMTKNIICAK